MQVVNCFLNTCFTVNSLLLSTDWLMRFVIQLNLVWGFSWAKRRVGDQSRYFNYHFQYFTPYKLADMRRMASAFNSSVNELEDELMPLILDGQIQARIDSQNKVRRKRVLSQITDRNAEIRVLSWAEVRRLLSNGAKRYSVVASRSWYKVRPRGVLVVFPGHVDRP